MGSLSLRRRRDPVSGGDIYEIKLDDEFLMSSLFTASEVALAQLGLAALSGTSLDVVVGGLGLGYTARAVLEHAQVGSLLVVDALAEVIEWHQRGLLPFGAELTSNPRCQLALGDFFAAANSKEGFDADHPGRHYHAILVDIDHSPKNVLHPSHAVLYTVDGLTRLAAHLHPGGVFALWSNDPPDDEFQQAVRKVFATSEAHIIAFENMRKDGEVTNTVYVATRVR
jgi:spermidine synthase